MPRVETTSAVVVRRWAMTFARREADGTVVWLRGEYDVFNVRELWETMMRSIAADDADLIIDLSGVVLMDASTIGVILTVRQMLAVQSRSLRLRSPPGCAQRLVDRWGLTVLVESPFGPAAALDGTLPPVTRPSTAGIRPVRRGGAGSPMRCEPWLDHDARR